MKRTASQTPARWWDLSAALLLGVAMLLAALRLGATRWTEELPLIQTVTLLGVIAGLALGQSAFGSRAVGRFASIYGLFVIGWQLGLTFGNGILWSERMLSFGGRLGVSLANLFQRKAVSDPILFVLIMSLLFWLLSSHAGYTLTREANPWKGLLPMGLALFIIHIHDPYWPTRSWFLAGYIFLALVLVSRVMFLRKRAAWVKDRTHMPPYIGLDFLRATLLAGAFLIIFSWSVPALAANFPPFQQAWATVSRPLDKARARMNNAFAALRSTVGFVNEYYGGSLPLGRGNVLTDSVVLLVEAPLRPAAGVRYYWRARVYDFYSEGQWAGTNHETRTIRPDQENALRLPAWEGRWEAAFTFTAGMNLSTLYTVPQPQWISRPVSAEFTTNPDGTADLAAIQASSALRAGETYEVRAALTNVTISQLRAAGLDYPAWVKGRYLQLPETITPRTLELARQIAKGHETPYDIVEAITTYLRENIQYNDTVPTPPAGQEPIDWMLFDLRQGFCNYYATAEIMLLRSLGIPARLAVGYAQGQRDLETNTYTVLQRDAHAWPEVYFPGIGWVEFEPTLNQRPIRRPAGDPLGGEESSGSSALPNLTGDTSSRLDREQLLGAESLADAALLEATQTGRGAGFWATVAVAVASIAGTAGFILYRRQRLKLEAELGVTSVPLPLQLELQFQKWGLRPPRFIRQWAFQATLPPQARAYQEVNRALRRLGVPPLPHHTPAERVATLARLLPAAAAPTAHLLHEYHSLAYNSTPGDSAAAQNAARTLRRLVWGSLAQQFFSRFQEPKAREALV